MVLYAASDCVDTDWAALLTDVYPDGRSIKVGEGILRASYRESLEHPSFIEPDRAYEYRIELLATAISFMPGHRIRLDIMSCRFPQFDVNPNTGAPVGDDEVRRVAHQTVLHSRAYPSRVMLPVLPAASQ